jgi:hypothetical protein
LGGLGFINTQLQFVSRVIYTSSVLRVAENCARDFPSDVTLFPLSFCVLVLHILRLCYCMHTDLELSSLLGEGDKGE